MKTYTRKKYAFKIDGESFGFVELVYNSTNDETLMRIAFANMHNVALSRVTLELMD